MHLEQLKKSVESQLGSSLLFMMKVMIMIEFEFPFKIMTALILFMLVLLLVELRQHFPSKCYCGDFSSIS